MFLFQDSNSPRQSGLSLRTGKSLFSELTASVFTSLGKYRADLEWLSLSLFFLFQSLSAEGTFVSLGGTRGIRLNESVGRIMERTCHTLEQIREGFTPLDTFVPFYIRRYLITPFLRLTKCNLTLVLSTSVP